MRSIRTLLVLVSLLELGVAGAIEGKIELSGKWGAACHDGPRGKWVEEEFEFMRGDHFKREQKLYTERSCPIESLWEARAYAGMYKLATGPKENATIQNIDFTITELKVTAYGEKAAKEFNDSKLCKITDWKQGQRRDITGLFCSGEAVSVGTVAYDVVQRFGDVLYFGDKSYFRDSSKLKNRPVTMDKSVSFLKGSAIAE